MQHSPADAFSILPSPDALHPPFTRCLQHPSLVRQAVFLPAHPRMPFGTQMAPACAVWRGLMSAPSVCAAPLPPIGVSRSGHSHRQYLKGDSPRGAEYGTPCSAAPPSLHFVRLSLIGTPLCAVPFPPFIPLPLPGNPASLDALSRPLHFGQSPAVTDAA